MTTKQRNFFIICGAILVAWYGYGFIANMERQAAFRHQQAIRAQQRQQAKPKPAVPAAKAPASQAGAAPLPAPHPATDKSAAAGTSQPPAPFAKLAGLWRGRAIHFHADKTLGTDINGCSVSSFTLTPFGSNRLAAEWQAGSCQGGHMVLAKAPR